MKRLILTVLFGLVLSGCSLLPQKAGIEIMSYPPAKVMINGKEAGMTPYKNNSMKPGEIELQLVTSNSSWSKKINLPNGVNTVIDREFGMTDKDSSGYVLTLESTGDSENTQLMINTTPDKAAVNIDGEIVGMSPLRLKDIGEGEKQISISLPRHKTITVLIKAIKGYQTVIEADLMEETEVKTVDRTANATPTGVSNNFKVLILETETGWLRIRGQPNTVSAEVGRVNPGETYEVVKEDSGYYEIDLGGGKTGWISAKYAEKS